MAPAPARTTLPTFPWTSPSSVAHSPTSGTAIHLFKPIWNNEIDICYGFGKHGDDPKTRANLRSPWDTLHPGRDWAHRDPNMQDARPRQRILSDISNHFAANPIFETTDMILRCFLDEMTTLS